HYGLTIESQNEAQGGMRGRVLRPEVQGPEIFLVGPFRGAGLDQLQRHDSIPRSHKEAQRTQKNRTFCVSCASLWLTFCARDNREVVALAAATQRVILAQRKRRELLRHQNPAQVRVPLETDSVHVVHLTLHPVRPTPERERRRNRQVR